jgi:hypothetical protein
MVAHDALCWDCLLGAKTSQPMPAASPHFSTHRFYDFLEIEMLVPAGSYLALALEVFFPLILLRRARPVLIIVGVVLHLGTAISFRFRSSAWQ